MQHDLRRSEYEEFKRKANVNLHRFIYLEITYPEKVKKNFQGLHSAMRKRNYLGPKRIEFLWTAD